jgi:hypothetical protein
MLLAEIADAPSSIVQAVVDDIVNELETINAAWAKDFGNGQKLIHLSTHGNDTELRVVMKVNTNFDKDHFNDAFDHVVEMLRTAGHMDGILPVHIKPVRLNNGTGSFTVSKMVKEEEKEHKVPFHMQMAYKFYQQLEQEQKAVEGDNVWMGIKIHHMAVPREGKQAGYCSQVVVSVWNSTPKEVTEHMIKFSTHLFHEAFGPETILPMHSKRTIDTRDGGGVNIYFEFWPL